MMQLKGKKSARSVLDIPIDMDPPTKCLSVKMDDFSRNSKISKGIFKCLKFVHNLSPYDV